MREALTNLGALLLSASLAWGQQVVLSGQFTLSGQRSTSPYTLLFDDGFESGDTTAWDNTSHPAKTAVQGVIKHAGSYAVEFHYQIAAGAPASQDDNAWVSKVINPGYSHFFMRGYIYFKTPEVGIDTFPVQRKLIWLGDSTAANNNVGGNYQVIINSFTVTPNFKPDLRLVTQYNGGGACPGSQLSRDFYAGELNWDTWYGVEIEIVLNTPGSADGTLAVWLDGAQIYTASDVNFRRGCTTPISFFSIGEQVNRTNSQEINEYRYGDNWKIATGYIGP